MPVCFLTTSNLQPKLWNLSLHACMCVIWFFVLRDIQNIQQFGGKKLLHFTVRGIVFTGGRAFSFALYWCDWICLLHLLRHQRVQRLHYVVWTLQASIGENLQSSIIYMNRKTVLQPWEWSVRSIIITNMGRLKACCVHACLVWRLLCMQTLENYTHEQIFQTIT